MPQPDSWESRSVNGTEEVVDSRDQGTRLLSTHVSQSLLITSQASPRNVNACRHQPRAASGGGELRTTNSTQLRDGSTSPGIWAIRNHSCCRECAVPPPSGTCPGQVWHLRHPRAQNRAPQNSHDMSQTELSPGRAAASGLIVVDTVD